MSQPDKPKDRDLMNSKDVSDTRLERVQRSLAKSDGQASRDKK